VPGVSFLEPTLAALGLDLLPSLYVGDALVVAGAAHPPFSASQPVLLSQVYSRAVASDVKLTLMNQYPDSHSCALVHDAGGVGTAIEWLPIHSIDFSTRIGPRTSLYVPPLDGSSSWEAVMDGTAAARDGLWGPWAEGDPTHSDAAAALVDAATRAASAADGDDPQALQGACACCVRGGMSACVDTALLSAHGTDALADVLRAVALHAHVAADEGQFNGRDVLTAAAAKAREGEGASGNGDEAPVVPAGRGYIVEDDEEEEEED
jgi:tetrapyrrole methylase family protein/MazG family protein